MAAYTPATLSEVEQRVNSILNNNPNASWAAQVSPSGDVGAYPWPEEIEAACLEADSIVCVDGYFQSANDAMANHFNVTSGPLAPRENIPFHRGTLNKVELSAATKTFTRSTGNVLASVAHGLATGELVSCTNVGGALPTGLTELTNYYVIVLTVSTFSLATSYANAVAGIPVVISDPGSGTNTLISWVIGVEANDIDDITNMVQVGEAYIGSGTADFLFKEDSGVIYTPATYARVTYPEYTKTSAMQCNETEKTLAICLAIKLLVKNASPAPFEAYAAEADRGLQQLVQDGVYTSQLSEQNLP